MLTKPYQSIVLTGSHGSVLFWDLFNETIVIYVYIILLETELCMKLFQKYHDAENIANIPLGG